MTDPVGLLYPAEAEHYDRKATDSSNQLLSQTVLWGYVRPHVPDARRLDIPLLWLQMTQI